MGNPRDAGGLSASTLSSFPPNTLLCEQCAQEGPSLHLPGGSVPSPFLAKPPGHLTTIHCVSQRRPLRRVQPGVCTETMCKVGRQS